MAYFCKQTGGCLNALLRISLESSRKAKMSIIRECYKNNPEFWEEFWRLTLSYDVSFGIKTLHSKIISLENEKVNILDVLKKLSIENTGNDAIYMFASAVSNISQYETFTDIIATLSPQKMEIVRNIITRQLRVGVDSHTVNDAIEKDIVKTFSVMRANNDRSKIKFPCLVEPKLDGVRIIAIPSEDGNYSLFTRNGKQVKGFKDIEDRLEYINGLIPRKECNIVFDGELYSDTFRRQMELLFTDETDKKAEYIVFDVMSDVYFRTGGMATNSFDSQRLVSRRNKIKDFVSSINDGDCVYLIEQDNADNEFELNKLVDYYSSYYEGVVVKKNDYLYKFRKSDFWIKIKKMHTLDVKVVGFTYGNGKYQNKIGALVCEAYYDPEFPGVIFQEFEYGLEKVQFEIGSGLTDSQRELEPSSLIGKTIEISYQEIHPDTWKPRFGTLVCFREDK